MSPLSNEEIAALLKPSRKPRESKPQTTKSKTRSIQLGPLGWSDEVARCVSRGCGSTTLVRINGIVYCVTHALYVLNKMLITDYDLDQCTCNAGRHSYGNIHTDDCPLFQEKKLRDTELLSDK